MSIAMAHDSADAQSSSAQRETSLPSSITAVERSGDNQSTSLRQGSVDQKVTNPCSLRAPDNISQSPAMGKQASMTIGTFAYTPLSAHCRSEEHTSELQSLTNLVCRLLLEKKKKH